MSKMKKSRKEVATSGEKKSRTEEPQVPLYHLIPDKQLYKMTKVELKEKLRELKGKGISKDLLRVLVRKYKKRLQYQKERKEIFLSNKKVCFHCRKPGHILSNCPTLDGDGEKSAAPGEGEATPIDICFKCGSTEHKIYNCKLKISNFPYAKCFVCNELGHLSRQCTQNPNGAYPQGGVCGVCGKKDHLKKDCPRKIDDDTSESHVPKIWASKMNSQESADVDIPANEMLASRKKKTKVVKF